LLSELLSRGGPPLTTEKGKEKPLSADAEAELRALGYIE